MSSGTLPKISETPTPETPPWEYFRDPVSERVWVLAGFNTSLSVHRGRLVAVDGAGRQRRTRTLLRAQREVERIVILGHTGFVSLEAIKWCHDTGVSVVNLEPDGTDYMIASPIGRDDPRIRRSQAAAANNAAGLAISRRLLGDKVASQAAILTDHTISAGAAGQLRGIAARIRDAETVAQARSLEADASNLYFGAWTGTVTCSFDATARRRFPDTWATYPGRRSLLQHRGRRNQNASDPINALLNYGYTLLAAEAQLALRVLGLDPGMGIVHTDAYNRDSLALDLMEPVRPAIDDHVLTWLATHTLTGRDVYETPQGGCRLLPALIGPMTDVIPGLARPLAIHADAILTELAHAHPHAIELTTPLSRVRTRNAETGPTAVPLTPRKPVTATACKDCGTTLSDPGRDLCPKCFAKQRREQANRQISQLADELAQLRAQADPTQDDDWKRRRAVAQHIARQANTAWIPTPEEEALTTDWYSTTIQPYLQALRTIDIQTALGVSHAAASRIRNGKLIPHRRHWKTLRQLAP